MLRKIRLTLAVLFFTLITWLFLDFTGTAQAWFGWLAKLQFVPAVLALNAGVVIGLVLLTLVCGRVYCSVICPLGVLQDLVSGWAGRRKKHRFRYSKALNGLRYVVLALFLAAMVAGFGAAATLLAPYSAYGRMVSQLLAPFYRWGNNGLALLAERWDSYAFYAVDVWFRSWPVFLVALLTLALIVVLAWRGGRTYCNTICPVGTVLGVLSRWAWFRPVIDTSKCNACGLCARNCKASCIDVEQHRVDTSRCVACMNCLDRCRRGAIRYAHKAPVVPSAAAEQPAAKAVNQGRRSFLTATAGLTLTSLLRAQEKTVDGGLAVIEDKKLPDRATPIVPPGAQSARHLARYCTACQLCVSACPNDVLRPSTGLATLMQPEMAYDRGYCRPECTRCSEVCPAGAIRPLSVADKSATQIGHAVWIKENCVPLTDGVDCGNCARHCPSGAILMVPSDPDVEDSPKIPVVNVERCIGCGACENLCPVRPFSAIYVEGHEVHRTL